MDKVVENMVEEIQNRLSFLEAKEVLLAFITAIEKNIKDLTSGDTTCLVPLIEENVKYISLEELKEIQAIFNRNLGTENTNDKVSRANFYINVFAEESKEYRAGKIPFEQLVCHALYFPYLMHTDNP